MIQTGRYVRRIKVCKFRFRNFYKGICIKKVDFFRMPDDIEAQRETYRQMNKSAFVLGYTGEVGKELVKELLRSKVFNRVTLIGRRTVNYEDELYKDVVCM